MQCFGQITIQEFGSFRKLICWRKYVNRGSGRTSNRQQLLPLAALPSISRVIRGELSSFFPLKVIRSMRSSYRCELIYISGHFHFGIGHLTVYLTTLPCLNTQNPKKNKNDGLTQTLKEVSEFLTQLILKTSQYLLLLLSLSIINQHLD